MRKKNKIPGLLAVFVIATLSLSCQKSETRQALNAPMPAAEKKKETFAQGPWVRQFTDDFNDASSFNRWTRTNRADYNSSSCHYQSANPIIGN